ncbi:MAG: glycosyltransferase family 4 protein [Desulfobacterales bacterium]|nr:glycosyltransferase family 4 protein [Desulfobacterales bacterium]
MQSNPGMKFKIGSPATGSNYFPRPEIEEEIVEALEGDHVSLLSPRRTGKTSLLFHLRDTSAGETTYFFINLEKFRTPHEWVAAMLECLLGNRRFYPLLSSCGKAYKKLIGMVKQVESVKVPGFGAKIREVVGEDWRSAAEKFLRVLEKEERSVVFLLDEFPILVNRIAKEKGDIESMLRWFRDWRQENRDSNVRFLVTGSIGLDNVVRRLGLGDTINDLNTVELLPLTQERALEFMTTLAASNHFELPMETQKKMLSLLGPPWPYFLQIFSSEVRRRRRKSRGPLTDETVEKVYRERLISGHKNKYLPHMFDRLKEILDPLELALARAILMKCAMHPGGLRRDHFLQIHQAVVKGGKPRDVDQLDYVLDILKHDGYLIQSFEGERRTTFFSNMLRDYWKERAS